MERVRTRAPAAPAAPAIAAVPHASIRASTPPKHPPKPQPNPPATRFPRASPTHPPTHPWTPRPTLGARQVEGAEVTVYRIKDPILGDVPEQFDEGVLDSPVATPEVVLAADCILVGRGLHPLTSELNLRTFGTHRSR